ncbi:MAG: DUF2153 domain-containing protein [Desulfurococcales archaeon]|nr:DUF2153 domain-containing protein [Desulfurococcales archaeon]
MSSPPLDPRLVEELVANLERWVKVQEVMLRNIIENEGRVKSSDRLELVLAIRTLFNGLVRTLKAFDNWLQDPFIVSQIPREALVEVWEETLKAYKTMVSLDIKHTSEMGNIIRQNLKEGTLNPIIVALKEALQSRSEQGETRVHYNI